MLTEVASNDGRNHAEDKHHLHGDILHREVGSLGEEGDRTGGHSCKDQEEEDSPGGRDRRSGEVEAGNPRQARGAEASGILHGHRSSHDEGFCHGTHHGIRLCEDCNREEVALAGRSHRHVEGMDGVHLDLGSEIDHECRAEYQVGSADGKPPDSITRLSYNLRWRHTAHAVP